MATKATKATEAQGSTSYIRCDLLVPAAGRLGRIQDELIVLNRTDSVLEAKNT